MKGVEDWRFFPPHYFRHITNYSTCSLKPNTKRFIEENIDAIESNDWREVERRMCMYDERIDRDDFITVLKKSGITIIQRP